MKEDQACQKWENCPNNIVESSWNSRLIAICGNNLLFQKQNPREDNTPVIFQIVETVEVAIWIKMLKDASGRQCIVDFLYETTGTL